MSKKCNLWIYDSGWTLAASMPSDLSGVSLEEARLEYSKFSNEYKSSQLLILPIGIILTDEDVFGTKGGVYRAVEC